MKQGDIPTLVERPLDYWEKLDADMREVVGALAEGAVIVFEGGGPRVRTPAPKMDGPTWDRLCHHGWLEPMPNGGTFKLSDQGLKSYLRSTDEMGDGKLNDPHEFMP